MSSSRKIVETYQMMLNELVVTGPNDQWILLRRLTNQMLQAFELQLQYDKQGGNSGLTDDDRANIKEATQLRRKIYIKIKSLKEST